MCQDGNAGSNPAMGTKGKRFRIHLSLTKLYNNE